MKGSGPEETLRKGSMPKGNGGLKSPGNYQGTPEHGTAHSNQETLGDPPAPQAVKMAPMDMKCQKAALAERKRETGQKK
jgi:hypothetical protein